MVMVPHTQTNLKFENYLRIVKQIHKSSWSRNIVVSFAHPDMEIEIINNYSFSVYTLSDGGHEAKVTITYP